MEPKHLSQELSLYIDVIVDRLAVKLPSISNITKAYFNLNEASTYTGLSHDYLRDQIYAGRLMASDLGTKKKPMWRVAKTHLDSFMTQEMSMKENSQLSMTETHARLPPSKHWSN